MQPHSQLSPPLSASALLPPQTRDVQRLASLFFLSGFPALIYQIVWQTSLFRIFGVNIESVTVVVAAFMVGLGLGSLAGGRFSARTKLSPLLLLGVIEISTAIFGVFSLDIFASVGDFTLTLPLAGTALVTLLLVLVPTLLMGATLPVLVSHLVRRNQSVGEAVSLLYCVNTMGAGVASLIIVPILIASFGLQVTVWCAVAINLFVGLGAVALNTKEAFPTADSTSWQPSRPHQTPLPFGLVLALSFLSGFVALSYEIFLYRVYSFSTGGPAWAFPVLLGVYLLGLAVGSYAVGHWLRERRQAYRNVALMTLGANLAGLLVLPAVAASGWLNASSAAVLPFVLVLGCLWGGVLPILAESGIASNRNVGYKVGLLYLANIGGSLSGSLGTGFFLLDHLGIVSLAEFLVGIGILSTLFLTLAFPLGKKEKGWLAAGIAACCSVLPAHSQLANDAIPAALLGDTSEPLRHLIENKSGIIAATADGTVYGHGAYDGRFNTDLLNDRNVIVRAYLLNLYNPHPRHVLMVGLSSGSWAQVIANAPGVEKLTVVEINDGYSELVSREPEVRSLLSNPKVQIVKDDGRRWLRRHPEARFDAIIMNTTIHHRNNASNLLSREFVSLVRAHLAPGGTFQYNTTGSIRAKRTGCLGYAFGFSALDQLLLSDKPINLDYEAWRKALSTMQIDGKPVIPSDESGSERTLPHLITKVAGPDKFESCQSLLARTPDTTPITDDNRGTEWHFIFGFE